MAAAQLATPTTWRLQHIMPSTAAVTKVTASDWVHFPEYMGVWPLAGMNKAASSGASTCEAAWTWGTATVSANISATDTSMAVTSATVGRGTTSTSRGFYIFTPKGEFIEVIKDSAPTTSSATFYFGKRGCFGTTASTITASDTVSICNMLFLGSAGVGRSVVLVLPFPSESTAKLFYP